MHGDRRRFVSTMTAIASGALVWRGASETSGCTEELNASNGIDSPHAGGPQVHLLDIRELLAKHG